MYVITGTSFRNVVLERNDKKNQGFCGTELERNKKLETGTELEGNEKIGDWNGTGTERKIWSERNGNMKCRSNGL